MARSKIRLDQFISELHDLEIEISRAYIMEGRVRVNDRVEHRPGIQIPADSNVVVDFPEAYSSRASQKLLGAIEHFEIQLKNQVCLDIGASHGGFTGVLLNSGATIVYAIDVAYGIFDYNLRNREEVTVLERKNIRDIAIDWFVKEHLAGPFLCVSDISFMSVRTVLSSLDSFFLILAENLNQSIDVEMLLLCKPQFEASGKTDKGILKDTSIRSEILETVRNKIEELHYDTINTFTSTLPGRKGNTEVFFYIRKTFKNSNRA